MSASSKRGGGDNSYIVARRPEQNSGYENTRKALIAAMLARLGMYATAMEICSDTDERRRGCRLERHLQRRGGAA